MIHLGTNAGSVLQLKMPAVGMTGGESEVTGLSSSASSILQLKMPQVGITGEESEVAWFIWAPVLAAFCR